MDEKSIQFRNLPADVRHEILTDLKETRKQNSWGRIHELPKQSDDFATYQMKRLLKRFSIQSCLEEAEKEMGGATLSLNELESLLNDHGVITENKGNRIASDENTRYLYIKDVKKTLESTKIKELKDIEKNKLQDETSEAAFKQDLETAIQLSTITEEGEQEATTLSNVEKSILSEETSLGEHNESKDAELDRDLEAAIQLSLQSEDKPSVELSKSTEDLSGDIDFQKDLAAAIKLSLQETPSTSSSVNEIILPSTSQQSPRSQEVVCDEISSSDTTPMSSQDMLNPDLEFSNYLETLRDSDFNSSDDEVKLDDSLKEGQKAADKIFSAARNYMMEYGGLTQAGVEEIFGQNEQLNTRPKIKGKSVKFHSNLIAVAQGKETCVQTIEPVCTTENAKIPDKEIDVGVMSHSDTSSDDDFVEVAAENADVADDLKDSKSETKSILPGLQIEFNTKDDLVDDIFSDIFATEPSVTKNIVSSEKPPEAELSLSQKSDVNTSQKSDVNTSVDVDTTIDDFDTQKAIEESINSNVEQNIPEKCSTSTLLQELVPRTSSSVSGNVSVESLLKLKSTLNQASVQLRANRGTQERLAGNISDQMYQETQDLLTLFGIPYIIAPMEAEAQCAFLNEISLTDGTITDDSDIWLFGGKTVYKNFFNHDKQVLEFRSESIQHHFSKSYHFCL